MRLTVFGATGRTGAQLVRAALAAGHEVTAVVRRPDAVGVCHSRLRVVLGDVLGPDPLTDAVAGADAVCSALGSRTPRQPTTLYSAGVGAMLAAMAQTDVSRIVVVTAIPAEPAELKSHLDRTVLHPLLHLFFGGGYDDMARMETLLARSDRDWTVLRPPRLTNRAATGRCRMAVDAALPHARTLSRADLAAAMLAATGDRNLIRHAVNIAS